MAGFALDGAGGFAILPLLRDGVAGFAPLPILVRRVSMPVVEMWTRVR